MKLEQLLHIPGVMPRMKVNSKSLQPGRCDQQLLLGDLRLQDHYGWHKKLLAMIGESDCS
jgi:hypothetical protein